MENNGYTPCRIEHPKFGRRRVLWSGAGFVATFVLLLIIGALGPTVFTSFETLGNADIIFAPVPNTATYVVAFSMRRTHQVFWMQSRMTNPQMLGVRGAPGELATVINMEVTVHGDDELLVLRQSLDRQIVCPTGQTHCDWFNLFSQEFIRHNRYRLVVTLKGPDMWEVNGNLEVAGVQMQMQSRVWSINPAYTGFEMAWKYLFLGLTLVSIFWPHKGFYTRLRLLPRKQWTFQQRWTLALLLLLVLLNDPLFVWSTFSTGGFQQFLSGLYVIFVTSFAFALLLFWLCVLDEVRLLNLKHNHDDVDGGKRHADQNSLQYWMFKVGMCASVAAVLLGAYFYHRANKIIAPQYNGVDDDPGSAVVFGALLISLLVVYIIWVLLLVVQSLPVIQNMSVNYRFLFAMTILSMLISIIMLLVAAFHPWESAAVTFMGTYGLYNMYVWTLAYSYAPVFSHPDEIWLEQGALAGSNLRHMHQEMAQQGAEFEDVDLGIADVPPMRGPYKPTKDVSYGPKWAVGHGPLFLTE